MDERLIAAIASFSGGIREILPAIEIAATRTMSAFVD
jgi:hypothetical protein